MSTAMTEVHRIEYHLIDSLGDRAIREITREEMQTLLNQKQRPFPRVLSAIFDFGYGRFSSWLRAKALWIGIRPRRCTRRRLQAGAGEANFDSR